MAFGEMQGSKKQNTLRRDRTKTVDVGWGGISGVCRGCRDSGGVLPTQLELHKVANLRRFNRVVDLAKHIEEDSLDQGLESTRSKEREDS